MASLEKFMVEQYCCLYCQTPQATRTIGATTVYINPDWTKTILPENFEAQFGLKFSGPGLYTTKTDTLLVLPSPPDKPATPENIWYYIQPEKTLYKVHVYNSPFDETIFSVIAKAPCRN